MRIKVALLEKDEAYLKRIVSVFTTRYQNDLEIYSFTEYEVALKTVVDAKIEVLIASDAFEINTEEIPKRCVLAYFTDNAEVEDVNGVHAIGRYQKADLIYRQILSLYAENAANVSKMKVGNGDCKFVAFASPAGGVGTSVAAAAFAMHCAQTGKKTLYLCLEDFGTADNFFADAGQFTMSEIIYALKSKKANLALKLESSVKRDASGVYFFSAAPLVLDMLELTSEEILRLMSELGISGGYEYIVLDLDFRMDKKAMEIYGQADKIVMVSDGSALANSKMIRLRQALATLEETKDLDILRKSVLLYNRFANSTGKRLDNFEMECCGGLSRVETPSVSELVKHLSSNGVWDSLM